MIDWEAGAGGQNRTGDLRFTKPLLYRLSYAGWMADENAHPEALTVPPSLRVSIERRIE
jgi:hypothetical protein